MANMDHIKCIQTGNFDAFIKNENIYDDPIILKTVWDKLDTFPPYVVDTLLNMKKFKNINVDLSINIFSNYIYKNNINLITTLVNNGIQMHNITLMNILFSNNKQLINYIVFLNIDLQLLWNKCSFEIDDLYEVDLMMDNNYSDFINDKIECINIDYFVNNFTCDILKTIVEFKVDISNKVNDIMIYAMKYVGHDLVKYCYDNGADNIDYCLKVACRFNKYEFVKFMLEKGANTHLIIEKDLLYISHDIFMLLISYEYNFKQTTLNKLFTNMFVHEDDMEKIYNVYSYVNTFDQFFEDENNLDEYDFLPSFLEYIVSCGKFDKIKMLEKYASDKLKLHLNRLFICAMFNGRSDIGEFLLSINNNVDHKLALKLVCYCGKYEEFKFILKTFGDEGVNDDLYNACAHGTRQSFTYITTLNSPIKYNNYNYAVTLKSHNDYINIISYLMSCNILMPPDFIKTLVKSCYTIKIFNHLMLNHDVDMLLEYCVKYNNFGIARYLLDNGAKYDINKIKNQDMIKLFNSYL